MYREAYAAWCREYGPLMGPYFTRAVGCWQSIEAFLRQNAAGILETLQPGVSAAQLEAAEEELGTPLPVALKALYRSDPLLQHIGNCSTRKVA